MASRSSDKKKRIALAVLGGVLLVAIVYQVFFSGPTQRPRAAKTQPGAPAAGTQPTQPSSSSSSGTPQVRRLGTAAQQEAYLQELLSDLRPLNPRPLTIGAGSSAVGKRGNIFAYYVPPPPPPVPAPPPPPIQLVSVQPPTAVAGTPRNVTLQIVGNKIPADAQIFIDGSPRATKRVSDTQLTTEISANDYASARNMNIEVKSQSNPAVENSNVITFVVQPSPEPQFAYKGRLGSLSQPQSNYAVFEMTGTREIKRAKVGDTIMGVWRVDSISADAVEVTHKQYDIKRRIALQDKVR